jgi:hypothetical protein
MSLHKAILHPKASNAIKVSCIFYAASTLLHIVGSLLNYVVFTIIGIGGC